MIERADASPRSWLFAPGHNEKLVNKVFGAKADAVILDLEDAVPADAKNRARAIVAEVASTRRCWVRVNRAFTPECEKDLSALRGLVAGFRIPKVEGARDIAWVVERAPEVPLDCTIESARGVVAALAIAGSESCFRLSYGGLDLVADLGIDEGPTETLFARSTLVMCARAAGKPPPSDGIYPMLEDDRGLREASEAARRLGFSGKAAVHPRQVPIINEVFSPTDEEVAWARHVLEAFEGAGSAAAKMADGEFVDLAVVRRARQVLERRQAFRF